MLDTLGAHVIVSNVFLNWIDHLFVRISCIQGTIASVFSWIPSWTSTTCHDGIRLGVAGEAWRIRHTTLSNLLPGSLTTMRLLLGKHLSACDWSPCSLKTFGATIILYVSQILSERAHFLKHTHIYIYMYIYISLSSNGYTLIFFLVRFVSKIAPFKSLYPNIASEPSKKV